MADIDPKEIDAVLQNASFLALVRKMQDATRRKILSEQTSDEDVSEKRRDLFALNRLLTELRKHATK